MISGQIPNFVGINLPKAPYRSNLYGAKGNHYFRDITEDAQHQIVKSLTE